MEKCGYKAFSQCPLVFNFKSLFSLQLLKWELCGTGLNFALIQNHSLTLYVLIEVFNHSSCRK